MIKDINIPKEVMSFIGGQWMEPQGEAYQIPVIHPATEETVSILLEADEAEVAVAVKTAKDVFNTGVWSKASVDERKGVLLKIKDLVLANKDVIARMEVTNTGVPISQAYGRQIPRSAMNFEFFAEFISQVSSPVFDQNPNFITFIRREPVGVAGLIAPWNARWRLRA